MISSFLRALFLFVLLCLSLPARAQTTRPNIVLIIADDQSWAHTSFAGDPVVKTPAFDRIAREGVYFSNAHCIAASCTPSRGALLTGRPIWQLEEGANLWSTLQTKFKTYPYQLEAAGYRVGMMGKAWGPGDFRPGGWKRNPGGKSYPSFDEFLKTVPDNEPLCFWMGSHHPHRPYKPGVGKENGLDPAKVNVPACMPDVPETRGDIADYLYNVQLEDAEAQHVIDLLEKSGRLDNTLIVMTSDNGMPFPHGKSSLYEYGTHMPLAIRWPAKIKGGRRVDDFVSHIDIAPTFYEATGVAGPTEVVGKSLMPLVVGESASDPTRDCVFLGNERHANARAGTVGYPRRAIRTKDFLYIHNYESDRWPAGDPPDFKDVDSGKVLGAAATKMYILDHRDEPAVKAFFDAAFGKRGPEELYDLKADPAEMKNVAADEKYADTKKQLRERLDRRLKETGDPRETGGPVKFDSYEYYGNAAMNREK